MPICPTCGRSTPEGRFCESCGSRLDTLLNFTQEYCTTLDARLAGIGFATKRNISVNPYVLGIAGQKKGVKELGVFFSMGIVFFSVMPMDNPDPARVIQFSNRIADLAKESGATSHWVMTLTIPVVVTETITSEMRAWIAGLRTDYRYNMIVFPAIAVHSSREIVFSQKTGFVGAAGYPAFRAFTAQFFQW